MIQTGTAEPTENDTTVTSTEDDALADLRARLVEKTTHVDRHVRLLDVAQDAAALARDRAAEAERLLVCNASSDGDVLARRGEAAECAERVAVRRAALTEAEAERQRAAQAVVDRETQIERDADEAGATAPKAEIAACVLGFVENCVNVGAPLLKRQALVDRVRHEFPLASPIPGVGLDDLAREIGRRIGGNLPQHVVARWLLAVLAGPAGSVAAVRDTFKIEVR
jgi:hypothetical protein